MSRERYSRLLSIAILGLVALLCLPELHAESIGEGDIGSDLSAVLEVNEINSGRFAQATWQLGAESPVESSMDLEATELDLMPSTHATH